jgi:hypothetical protein
VSAAKLIKLSSVSVKLGTHFQLGHHLHEEEMAQQLNCDDIIDGFADAKARKINFLGQWYNILSMFYCLSQNHSHSMRQ